MDYCLALSITECLQFVHCLVSILIKSLQERDQWALYGALFGNALSDGIGAILDFGWLITFNIVVGCLVVIPLYISILGFLGNKIVIES